MNRRDSTCRPSSEALGSCDPTHSRTRPRRAGILAGPLLWAQHPSAARMRAPGGSCKSRLPRAIRSDESGNGAGSCKRSVLTASRDGHEDLDIRVHRVEPVLALRGADEDGAGAVVLDDGIAGIFLPVHQVAGSGYAGRPVFPGALGIGVVECVIEPVALDDLIDGHGRLVVRLGAPGDDRIILDVGPDLEVFRRRQPNSQIAPLVEEVPGTILIPGGGRAVRAGADGRPI